MVNLDSATCERPGFPVLHSQNSSTMDNPTRPACPMLCLYIARAPRDALFPRRIRASRTTAWCAGLVNEHMTHRLQTSPRIASLKVPDLNPSRPHAFCTFPLSFSSSVADSALSAFRRDGLRYSVIQPRRIACDRLWIGDSGHCLAISIVLVHCICFLSPLHFLPFCLAAL